MSRRECYFSLFIYMVFFLVCMSFSDVSDERNEQGYPSGLMSLCPGSTKPALIPKAHLRHLLFVVHSKNMSRKKYNYWTAKNIARDPRVDFNRTTMIFATGYLDSTNFPIARTFADLYLDLDYNVILLDYQRFATVHYYLATRLMRPVGKHIAEVLAQLSKSGLDPAKTQLLGFSLGGQVVGFIAKSYQEITGRNLSRITSLEPSGPCYRHVGPELRLSASDADFVQVIHTNIDGYGMAARMGHVDFYVNGGEYQPSDINLFPCTSTCSHFRVLTLWASALRNPGKFLGLKCDSIQQARDFDCYSRVPRETNVMGLEVDTKNQGVFFLSTTMWFPFYLGEKGLLEENAAWRRVTDVNDGNETVIFT